MKQNPNTDFILVSVLTPPANLDMIGWSTIDYIMDIYLSQKTGTELVLILTRPSKLATTDASLDRPGEWTDIESVF